MQLLDSDQELYKNFPLVISERWQQEVAETVYEAVNCDTDKNEARKRAKNKQQVHEEGTATRQVLRLIDISGVDEEEEEVGERGTPRSGRPTREKGDVRG